jgi:hypothetical protein
MEVLYSERCMGRFIGMVCKCGDVHGIGLHAERWCGLHATRMNASFVPLPRDWHAPTTPWSYG